jgi:hypothetical protein
MTQITRWTIRQHLINQGRAPEEVHKLLVDLPEHLDLQRDAALFEKLGVSIDQLMSERGASP